MKLKLESDTQSIVKELKGSIEKYINKSLKTLQRVLPDKVKRVFELEGARGEHEMWTPTTDVARRNRKSGNFDAPSLVDRGNLKASIVGDIAVAGPDEWILVVGTEVPYANTHQNGGTLTVNGMEFDVPKREFLFFTKDDEDTVFEVFENEEL